MDRDDAERSQRMVEEQIIRALANRKRTDEEDTPVFSELMRSDEEEKSMKIFWYDSLLFTHIFYCQ